MTSMIKSAVAAVLALGAFASANAGVTNAASGNGELFLQVVDNTTGDNYARGLQIFVGDLLSDSATGGTADPSFTTRNTISYALPTIAPDATLTSFLGTGHTYTYYVFGGDSVGSNTIGTRRCVFSSGVYDPSSGTLPSNANLSGLGTNFNTYYVALNNVLTGAAGASVVDPASSLVIDSNKLANTIGLPPGVAGADLGSASNFFMVSSGGGSNALSSRAFIFNSLTLAADGTLSAAATGGGSEVPVPAAVWLLGSGLAGLAGIGRRRKAA